MQLAYLHIGNGESVALRDIIGIFDMDTAGMASSTKAFLRRSERAGNVSYGNSDIPRAFILCGKTPRRGGLTRGNLAGEGHRAGIYKLRLSRISPAGLRERLSSDGEQT